MGNQSDIKLNIVVSVAGQQALNSLTSGIQRTNTAQTRAMVAAVNAGRAARAQADQMKGLSARLTDAETRYDALYRASYRLQIVGYQLVGAGKQMIGMVKSLTDQWGNFEFMVNRAAGAMQIWKNTAAGINPIYNALIDRIEQATKDLRLFPADDVAKATYFWASTTGQAVSTMSDLESVMSSVNPLMKVAAMTQTGYETAIKGVYSILVQYGKSLADTGDVTNKLFLVTQRTALEFPDLINSFKMVGPIAAAMGISFEEVAQTLGQLGDAGIRGTMAGRALRQVFIQLSRPTAKTVGILDALFKSTKGINKGFEETVFPNGKFVGLTGFVNALAVSLKTATQAQRQTVLASISTANEYPILTALVGNQIKVLNKVPGAYDAAKSSVTDSANAADQFNKSWELLATSWNGIVGRITRGAEVIKLKVGRDIAEALKPAIQRVTEFLDKIEIWVNKNPALIASLSRIVGFASAFAAIAGSVLIAVGALTGLYSAISVLAIGFGRLIAPLTIASGLFVTLGEAIVRNWTRITRVLLPAIQNLLKAMGLTGSGLAKAQDAWAKIHKTINDFMDFVVRVAIAGIRFLIAAITTLVNSPLVKLIPIILQVWVTFKALTVITGIAIGLWKTMTGVLAIMGMKFVSVSLDSALMGLNLEKSVGSLTKLKAAIAGMSLTGWLAVITAAVFLFQQLADMNFLGLGDFIDSITHGVKELRNEVADLLSEFGKAGKPIGATLDSIVAQQYPAIAKIRAQLDDLHARLAANPRDRGASQSLAILNSQLDDVTKHGLKDSIAALDSLKKQADEAGVGYEEFGARVVEGMKSLRLSFSDSQKYADDFFATVKNGAPTVEEAVTIWNDLARKGVKLDMTPEQYIKQTVNQADLDKYYNDYAAKSQIALAKADLGSAKYSAAYQILQGLKLDGTQYSEAITASIDSLMSGIPEAVKGIVTETADIATKAPKDIADAVIAGVAAIKDFKGSLKKALAGLISPGAFITGLLGNLGSADLKTTLLSSKLGAYDLAVGAIDAMTTTFADAYAAALQDPSGKSVVALQNAIKGTKGHKGLFTPEQLRDAALGQLVSFHGIKLTKEQQTAIQGIIDTLFPELAIPPTPAVVTATSTLIGNQFRSRLAAEFDPKYADKPTSTVAKDAMATLVSGMVASKTTLLDPFLTTTAADIREGLHIDLFSGGQKTGESWINGIKAALQVIFPMLSVPLTQIAKWTRGKSPPKAGPLKGIDKGGFNIGHAWGVGLASGMNASLNQTYAAVANVRDALGIQSESVTNSLNVDTNQQRTIKVQVEVTSPDGSVAKVDMKALAGALSGTTLVRSIEQAAAAR